MPADHSNWVIYNTRELSFAALLVKCRTCYLSMQFKSLYWSYNSHLIGFHSSKNIFIYTYIVRILQYLHFRRNGFSICVVKINLISLTKHRDNWKYFNIRSLILKSGTLIDQFHEQSWQGKHNGRDMHGQTVSRHLFSLNTSAVLFWRLNQQ